MSRVVIRTAFALLLVVSLVGAATPQNSGEGALRLVDAVKQKNEAAVDTLLGRGGDVNEPQADGATALHWAAYWDDVATLDRLIAAGADANAANDLKVTPLALAAANGSATIVERLLQAGADPDAAGETGVTPLMEAARTGSIDAARVLLDFDADVDARTDDRQQTALMWAVVQEHPAVVGLLLEYGADPHARTRTRRDLAMLNKVPSGTAKLSAEISTQIERGGNTAFLLAAQGGRLNSARILLGAGVEVNEAGADGNTPLVVAAFSGHGPFASWLLDEGADPNATGGGYTALHAATMRSDLETVERLLAHGANPDIPITRGSPLRRNGSQWALSSAWAGATPLIIAASYLELDVMRALVRSGASVARALPDGTTPLLVAAGITVERRLNRPGLDHTDTSTDIGDDCCDRAEDGILEAVGILLDAGAEVNEANEAGATALHAAASGALASVIQLLADRGADLNVKNLEGQTPLALTSRGGGRRGGGGPSPESQAAGELLRKLGATD